MRRDLEPEEADYSARLYTAVLNAVLTLDEDGTGSGGFVSPHLVRMTMADIAATVDNNCQLAKTPRDRRKFGEDMAKRYSEMLKSLQENPSAWQPATRVN